MSTESDPTRRQELLVVQRAFMSAMRNISAQQEALAALQGEPARNQELLAVYRGNAVGNARKALGLAYPVVAKIVGEEFFSGLCRAFWATQPSRSGDLNEYGEGFADFLASFPHTTDLPYLPDVARVEWRVCNASCAADHAALTLEQLAKVAPDAMGSVRFTLQPGLSLFESVWPVARIWLQHQPRYTGDIDVDLDHAERIVVHRLGFNVTVATLDAAEFALWHAAQAGYALAEMLAQAFEADESFDVQTALQAGFSGEFVIAVQY